MDRDFREDFRKERAYSSNQNPWTIPPKEFFCDGMNGNISHTRRPPYSYFQGVNEHAYFPPAGLFNTPPLFSRSYPHATTPSFHQDGPVCHRRERHDHELERFRTENKELRAQLETAQCQLSAATDALDISNAVIKLFDAQKNKDANECEEEKKLVVADEENVIEDDVVYVSAIAPSDVASSNFQQNEKSFRPKLVDVDTQTDQKGDNEEETTTKSVIEDCEQTKRENGQLAQQKAQTTNVSVSSSFGFATMIGKDERVELFTRDEVVAAEALLLFRYCSQSKLCRWPQKQAATLPQKDLMDLFVDDFVAVKKQSERAKGTSSLLSSAQFAETGRIIKSVRSKRGRPKKKK